MNVPSYIALLIAFGPLLALAGVFIWIFARFTRRHLRAG